jgi:invasion protein IalB
MRHAYSKFLLAPLLVLLPQLALAATPTQQTGTFQSTQWRIECGNDGKSLSCQMINHVLQANNQSVASVALQPGRTHDQAAVTVELPLGIAVTAPVQLKVDAGPMVTLVVSTCVPQGCIATGSLSRTDLDQALQGQKLIISFLDSSGERLALSIPLAGFALAYDELRKM